AAWYPQCCLAHFPPSALHVDVRALCELVHIGLAASAEYNFPGSVRPLGRFFHGMLRLRSSRQMLRQAIITSKAANAIVVANTVIIVANERTYITPYANVRNMLFPWTEKAPAIDGLGPVSTAIKSDPCFSADRARRFDTLRRAPGRPSAWAIRTASIPHHRMHRAPSEFRTL